MATNVTHQMELLNLISCIDRVKSSTFEKGTQNLKGDWTNYLSITFKRPNHICFLLVRGMTTATCHRLVANRYVVQYST